MTPAPEITQEAARAMLHAATNALSLLRALGCGDTFVAMTLADAIALAEGRAP
jgi:hypothetical protein